ncbi:MAG: hypothetical protein MJ204_11000 [Bacteroidales bacterium]|nr:hypothetical protein [Bacteroidales bacterium]
MFEKIFGTIVGVLVLICAIKEKFPFGIWQASSFIVLNLALSYEMFQSFVDAFDQSDFYAIVTKWFIVAILSCGIAFIGVSIFN